MSDRSPRVFLVRHGATAWARDGRHTGRTDIPLLPEGEAEARAAAPRLAAEGFTMVLTSPLRRARETCALAGFGERAELEPDLMEWDYGAYEGITTHRIRERDPGWLIFRDGCPDGETPGQVGDRADRVIARIRGQSGDVLLFVHGHFSRVLAARWLGLPAGHARYLVLGTAAVSVLGFEHGPEEPAILLWNDRSHLRGEA